MKTLYDIRKTQFYKLNKANHRGALFSKTSYNFQGLAQYIGCRIDLETQTFFLEPKGKGRFILKSTSSLFTTKFNVNLRQVCNILEKELPYFINPFK